MKKSIILLSISLLFLFMACSSDDATTPVLKAPQNLDHDYLDRMEETITPNFIEGVTNEKVALGRVLFYDKQLSLNNTIACASCHKPEFGFGDNKALSVGFENVLTSRNSPSLVNLATSNAFFWDMSQNDLQTQVVMPLTNHIEMGIPNMDYLIEKIKGIDYYPALFAEANLSITPMEMASALENFVISINAFESDFDNREEQALSAQQTVGKHLFLDHGCNNCHRVIQDDFIFIGGDHGFYSGGSTGEGANIGLDYEPVDEGAGFGIFKIPSLRNLAFSAPYMHDGRFTNLDEVIEHYDNGVKSSEQLDFRLGSNGIPNKLNMTPDQKSALKSFLLSLSDINSINQEMYTDPFQY